MFTYQEYCLETLSGGPDPLSRDKTKVKCSSEWYRCVFPDMPWVYLLPTICSSCCYRFLKTLPVLQTQHKCTWVISFVTASLPLSPPSAVYNSGANYSKCFIHIWTYLIFTTTWQGNYEYWHFIGEAHVIHAAIFLFLPTPAIVILHSTEKPHGRHSCTVALKEQRKLGLGKGAGISEGWGRERARRVNASASTIPSPSDVPTTTPPPQKKTFSNKILVCKKQLKYQLCLKLSLIFPATPPI